jgi:hypothetical protein
VISELELLHYAMWHARCEIVRHASAESCIISVRIVGKLCDHIGMSSIPMPVAVKCVNAQWRDAIDNGRDPEEDDAAHAVHIEHLDADDERAAQLDESSWPGGHLVLVAGGRYLIDPSADQLSYPDMGITTVPFVADMEDAADAFISGGMEDAVFAVPTEDGGTVAYIPHPEDLTYADSTDWQLCVPGDAMFDRIFDQTVGLIDLVRDAERLPPYAELPIALRKGDIFEPNRLRQAIRSGVELGEIEPTASGITNFLIRAGVPDMEGRDILAHREIDQIIRRHKAKQPQRVPRA